MANQFHVDVVAVEESVWSGEAEIVIAKTVEGELGILHGHMPLLGQLAEPSQVRIRQSSGQDLTFEVTGGFLLIWTEFLDQALLIRRSGRDRGR